MGRSPNKFYCTVPTLTIAIWTIMAPIAPAADKAKTEPRVVAVKVGKLFDGAGDNYRTNVVVVIENDRIR